MVLYLCSACTLRPDLRRLACHARLRVQRLQTITPRPLCSRPPAARTTPRGGALFVCLRRFVCLPPMVPVVPSEQKARQLRAGRPIPEKRQNRRANVRQCHHTVRAQCCTHAHMHACVHMCTYARTQHRLQSSCTSVRCRVLPQSVGMWLLSGRSSGGVRTSAWTKHPAALQIAGSLSEGWCASGGAIASGFLVTGGITDGRASWASGGRRPEAGRRHVRRVPCVGCY